MTRSYPSKRDVWIVALIWAGILLCLFAASEVLMSPTPLPTKTAIVIACGLAAVFMLWALYSIIYTLTDKHLQIRCGPFRYRVPLADIDSVTPTRNPLSSPAASLDRLLIKWAGERKRVMISPLAKKDFLRDLERRCPQLELKRDRLVRASAR